jgi:hypothetical protein
MNDRTDRNESSNGRKVVLLVVAVAFIASATTAMLAFTASHSAREADAKALAADTADLRGDLVSWKAQLGDALKAPEQSRQPYLDRLVTHTQGLSGWKPRTPCGQEARDRLVRTMEERARALLRGESGETNTDESSVLDSALRECEVTRGRDVTI